MTCGGSIFCVSNGCAVGTSLKINGKEMENKGVK